MVPFKKEPKHARGRCRLILLVAAPISVLSLVLVLWSGSEEGKVTALESLRCLESAVAGRGVEISPLVVVPAHLASKSELEREILLRRSLRDEVSQPGINVLKRDGKFGKLLTVFPEEAEAWASRANVSVEDCVAFRMEQDGLRAEVVLVTQAGSDALRVVRINNVKQMASAGGSGL